jgi:hypothetical protein
VVVLMVVVGFAPAIAAFLRGYAANAGMHDALVISIISLGFIVATPPESVVSFTQAVFVALIALGAALWITPLMFVIRGRLSVRTHTGLDSTQVPIFSCALAFLVAVATWFVVALNLGRAYWLFAALLMPAIVLVGSAGRTVDAVAEERLGATLIGIAATLIVMLALAPFATRIFAEPSDAGHEPAI